MPNSVINDYIAGAIGGMAGLVVGHPFDTTKVQMQTQQASSPYKGTFDAMRSINKHGWTKGFFRGLGFPLASYGIVNSVFFGVYGHTIKICKGSNQDRGASYREVFLAGCVGGFAQLFVACPVDLVKVVLQSQISKQKGEVVSTTYFKGPVHCLQHLYQVGGFTRCFHGFRIQLLRDVPASSSYFLTYEWTYDQIMRLKLSDSQGIAASLFSGGLAGVVSWGIIIPLDVVKSQIQADFHKERFRSSWQCAQDIYHTQGWKGFGTGFQACAIRAFIVNAAIFAVHKQTLELLEKVN